MNELKPMTVIYVVPGDIAWQGFNCMAEDSDHAEEQCKDAYPDCTVVWVNGNHNNMSME